MGLGNGNLRSALSPASFRPRAWGRLVRLSRLDVHMSTDFLDAGSEGSLSPDSLQSKVFM